jgi:hypothetical protein
MELTNSGEPTVEELRRLVATQREQVRSHAERIAALEASLKAALPPSLLRSDDPDRGLLGGDRLHPTRARFLQAAAAGAAGLAGASIVGWESGESTLAEAATSGQAGAGIVGAWIVSIAYRSGPHRTRGLATFSPGGGFVGSVSAYEHAPPRFTPSRGTTLHGTWIAKGGPAYAVTAVRLHMDGQGTLLGIMTTQIAATLAPGSDALDGSFTFKATHADERVFSRGAGTLHFSRIAPPS